MLFFERRENVEEYARLLEPSVVGYEVYAALPPGYIFVLVHSPTTDRWTVSYTLSPPARIWKSLGSGLDCFGRPTFATREAAEHACNVMHGVLLNRKGTRCEPVDH